MAKKENTSTTPKKESRNPLVRGIRSLNNITQATNTAVYGVKTDVGDILTTNVNDFIDKIQFNAEKDKSMINSHMTRSKLSNSKIIAQDQNSLYKLINDSSIMDSVQSLIGGQNIKFVQLLKDYEIIKRCIPQIHKVINSLKNNIISPDGMSQTVIGIELPASTSDANRGKINELIEKYELNDKLQEYVMDYLIASVHYSTVVPYNAIPNMLGGEYSTIDECIEHLQEEKDSCTTKTLYEALGNPVNNDINTLTESVEVEYYENDDGYGNPLDSKKINVSPIDIQNEVISCLNRIEFIKGGEQYFKNAILNEAVAIKSNMDSDTSMKSILNRLKDRSRTIHKDMIQTADGLVDEKTIKDIRKNVDFKGCHIEELHPSKVIPFKLRNTLIGYFYVEDVDGAGQRTQSNISTIMDKINASVYMKQDTTSNAQRVEFAVVRAISEKLIQAIDAKFINDNYDDMEIIYEFVRLNELHTKNKRVVFFHPDDICEFKRKDGSIMKNCMFLAKLYILTMLANILTNVTRGSDRNIHYVKTGLTTDIEGHVNAAIRAIKQGQIRYSDIGTINEIFNIVGSGVDVFMPVSTDGERPIETETISGQQVDMNNDFLQSMLKSIIQSFGVPSSVIDDFENIEFAKTIAMSNLDMAKAALDAQNEINPVLTKLVRLLITYELPDYAEVDEVYVKLTPPSVILFEMNKDRVDATSQMAEVLANLMFTANENETDGEKLQRLFKLKYIEKNMPNLDWDAIYELGKEVTMLAKSEILKNDVSLNDSVDQQPSYNNNY